MAPSCWREWTVGSHIVAHRNAHYWDNASNKIDTINYLHIADQGAELRRYRAGELDITYTVPPAQFKWIRENLGAELHISPQLSTYYYGYNLYRAPFKDNPKLRLALSMVIDRERLTESVTGRGELPAYGWVPVGVANYESQRPEWAELSFAERVATGQATLRAGRLLVRASAADRDPLQHRRKPHAHRRRDRIDVEGIARRARPSWWAKNSRCCCRTSIATMSRRYFRSSWIGDYNDAYTFAQYLKSDFGLNLPGYRNPRYDALLTSAASEVDTARRSSTLEEAERLMLLDQPVIPLYFYVNKHLVKPYVEGWHNNVMNVQYCKNLVLRKH